MVASDTRLPDVPESRSRIGPATAAAALAAAAALVVLLAALLDLGPFEDEAAGGGGFVAQADEICAAAHDEFVELQRTPPRTAGDAASLASELAGIAQEELEEIRSLSPPAGLEPDVERYLAARKAGIELLRRGAEAAESNDSEAYADLQDELARGQSDRVRLARALGLRECSRPLEGADAGTRAE